MGISADPAVNTDTAAGSDQPARTSTTAPSDARGTASSTFERIDDLNQAVAEHMRYSRCQFALWCFLIFISGAVIAPISLAPFFLGGETNENKAIPLFLSMAGSLLVNYFMNLFGAKNGFTASAAYAKWLPSPDHIYRQELAPETQGLCNPEAQYGWNEQSLLVGLVTNVLGVFGSFVFANSLHPLGQAAGLSIGFINVLWIANVAAYTMLLRLGSNPHMFVSLVHSLFASRAMPIPKAVTEDSSLLGSTDGASLEPISTEALKQELIRSIEIGTDRLSTTLTLEQAQAINDVAGAEKVKLILQMSMQKTGIRPEASSTVLLQQMQNENQLRSREAWTTTGLFAVFAVLLGIAISGYFYSIIMDPPDSLVGFNYISALSFAALLITVMIDTARGIQPLLNHRQMPPTWHTTGSMITSIALKLIVIALAYGSAATALELNKLAGITSDLTALAIIGTIIFNAYGANKYVDMLMNRLLLCNQDYVDLSNARKSITTTAETTTQILKRDARFAGRLASSLKSDGEASEGSALPAHLAPLADEGLSSPSAGAAG